MEVFDFSAALREPDFDAGLLDAHLTCLFKGVEFVVLADRDTIYGDICDPLDSGYGTTNHATPGTLYARFPEELRGVLGGGKLGNRVQGMKPLNYLDDLQLCYDLIPSDVFLEMRKMGHEKFLCSLYRAGAKTPHITSGGFTMQRAVLLAVVIAKECGVFA